MRERGFGAYEDVPLDAGAIQVFQDWLLERGFELIVVKRIPEAEGLPYAMEYKGAISTVHVYWFRARDGGMELSVQVAWKQTRTRIRVPYDQAAQRDVPLTWGHATEAVTRAMELSRRIDASAFELAPDVPDGMDQPPGLSPAGVKAYKVLLAFFKKEGLTYTGGGTTFFEPGEWAELQNDDWSFAADLVVVYDGGEPREAMTGDDARLYDRMEAALAKAGFHFEAWSHVVGGVYRD